MPKPTHAKRELTDKFIKTQTATGKLERFPDLLPNFYFYLYPDGAEVINPLLALVPCRKV
jgi:hypothetical protein